MIEVIIKMLVGLVALVVGVTTAFATFFVVQTEKIDGIRRKIEDER